MEDQYEHKLAVEMERYDKLSEDIELMKDECNAKLEDQKMQSETAMREFEQRANRMEQQLRHQVRLLFSISAIVAITVMVADVVLVLFCGAD